MGHNTVACLSSFSLPEWKKPPEGGFLERIGELLDACFCSQLDEVLLDNLPLEALSKLRLHFIE